MPDAKRFSHGRTAVGDAGAPALPFGYEGRVVAGVGWAATRFNAVVRVDDGEVKRRTRFGLGAVLEFRLLEAISTLPLNRRVAWASVDPVVAAVLDCAPDGVVETSPKYVTLRLAPPVELVGTFVVARHWRAMGRVGVLRHVAPVGVLVRHHPRSLPDALAVAGRGGVGLAVLDGEEATVLAEPRAQARPTIGRRRVLEAVFGEWLRQTTVIPAS